MKNILVTGSAGFIGFHLVKALLGAGYRVLGIDNMNDYYDPKLKQARLDALDDFVGAQNCRDKYQFYKLNIADRQSIENLFGEHEFSIIIHLAAQAGVRYSLKNPYAYMDANLNGFINMLEACRRARPEHFIFASSSSVYGMNIKQPFRVEDNTDFPISLYAATKKSNELMAHAYSHLFSLPMTGLRFFTVYGPYGRPDMAYYKFTKAIMQGKPIDVYNQGDMKRDFTYIDDIIDAIMGLLAKPPVAVANPISHAKAPFHLFNIGGNQPIALKRLIQAIETACGKKAQTNLLPMQAGDVPTTYADIDPLTQATGFAPSISIEEGMAHFVEWFKACDFEVGDFESDNLEVYDNA